jgi:hypothetical protein
MVVEAKKRLLLLTYQEPQGGVLSWGGAKGCRGTTDRKRTLRGISPATFLSSGNDFAFSCVMVTENNNLSTTHPSSYS